MSAKLIHTLNDSVELNYSGRPLFKYVYNSQAPAVETKKPYFHPLYSLAGNVVTNFRPHDHAWHHGISMTMANLSGQNFWGGASYIKGKEYVQLDNNGRIQHTAWHELSSSGDKVAMKESLEWITFKGELWLAEERTLQVNEINTDKGYWSLDYGIRLKNVCKQELVFGSPTTEGRPMAGYGGLFWRGPRSFNGGKLLGAGGLEGQDIMGKRAEWVSYTGAHDGTLDKSTLLFIDQPGNLRYPTKWFVRNDPFPVVSFAFSFDELYILRPGKEINNTYRILIANGDWDREKIEFYLENNGSLKKGAPVKKEEVKGKKFKK